MTPLRRRTTDYMLLRGYAASTIKSYLNHISHFACYFKACPSTLNQEDVKVFLSYLLKEKNYTQSSLNGAYGAIKILFVHVLEKPWDSNKLPRSRRIQTLPCVLSQQEIAQLFEVTINIKHRTILMILYCGGLRLSEVVRLKISDIDSKRMLIRVHQGKGKKDRYTILSQKMLVQLRNYYKIYRPMDYLFSGANPLAAISIRTVQHIFKKAKGKTSIRKKASVHTLRHCFATHLIEDGVDVTKVQLLLGHKDVRTTCRYLHLSTKHLNDMDHPMDKE